MDRPPAAPRTATAASAASRSEAPTDSLWRVHVVLVLVQCGYAGAYVLSKVALTTGVNPIVFAIYRDVVALCTIAPLAYFTERGKRSRLDLKTVALFALLGFIGVFGSQVLLLYGLKLATASLSSVISITIPVCIFFMATIFGSEDMNWRRFDGQAKMGGLMCAVVGGVVVAAYRGPAILGSLSSGLYSSPGTELQVDGSATSPVAALDISIETWQIGVILLFLGGFCFATYITIQVSVLKTYPAPISLTIFAYFFGVLPLAILGLVTVQDSSEWVITQPSALMSALYGGFISSGANFSFQAWALQRAGPVLIASYNPLQPFFTSALALLVLGESLHLGSVLGTLLIISGLYLITWGKIKGGKLGSLSVEAGPNSDGPPTNKANSSLEEPLLT